MMKIRAIFACLVLLCILGVSQGGSLRKNFYRRSCPKAEEIVKNVTWKHVAQRPELPAKLLRMHFHDCFVRGCDGSVLINSTANNTAEKDATPNLSLAGFDVVDDIKTTMEKQCPGVVSCADILALSTRDAVSFQFNTSMWEVLTGRRDGTVSRQSEALNNIVPPTFNFTQLKQSFATKNLTAQDLVVLYGGHTIGVGHCNFFSNRLYNFTGRGDQDPSLNTTYATFLKSKCRSLNDTTAVELDPQSSKNFDSNYFNILLQNKGIFESDAAIITNKKARQTVQSLTSQSMFFNEFGKSMKKMGAIEVLTGSAGEIRKQCAVVNS